MIDACICHVCDFDERYFTRASLFSKIMGPNSSIYMKKLSLPSKSVKYSYKTLCCVFKSLRKNIYVD